MAKGKEEGKEKEKVKEKNIAESLNSSELNLLEKIYGNLLVKAGESLPDKEVIKLGDKYLTSESMLELFSKQPEEAYKKLSAAQEFNIGMFIKLIVYEEICSKGKFTFKHPEYLLKLVQEGSFNLQDPMLLAYAVRLSNEKLALSVTKELVKKGAVIADNILFHSYNNPDITKFLLIEKPSIITCQNNLMGTDAVIKKVQTKILQSTSKTEQHKFKTTLELLKAAKTGGEDLNIKLDIICPPIFDNEYSKNFFEKYSELYKAFGKYGFSLLNNKQIAQTYQVIEEIIKAGGNLKGVSKEFENYVCGTSSPEIVKLLFKEPIPQDVSSTTSTTTTSVSTTSSLEKPSSSSGSSSTSESYTTTAYDSTHDKARITIDEISYNTKITENKVELRDATSDELVCIVQIENGRVKLIYSSHEIYTIEEDGWLFHNICGRFSGFFDKGSLHKREIIHVCENLLKQQAGGATGNSDSTTLSSSSSSTSEPKTAITSVSATTLPLGGDYIDGENMSTTVTTSSLITLSSSTTIESISDVSLAGGDSSSTDAA